LYLRNKDLYVLRVHTDFEYYDTKFDSWIPSKIRCINTKQENWRDKVSYINCLIVNNIYILYNTLSQVMHNGQMDLGGLTNTGLVPLRLLNGDGTRRTYVAEDGTDQVLDPQYGFRYELIDGDARCPIPFIYILMLYE